MSSHWAILSLVILSVALQVHGAHNIEDYGAIAGNTTLASAVLNGQALVAATMAAETNVSGDRTVLIPSGKTFIMVPHQILDGLHDITFTLMGTLEAFSNGLDTPSSWPVDTEGRHLNFIDIRRSSNITFDGTGTVDGKGYFWWWHKESY